MNPLVPISISLLALVVSLVSLSRTTTYKTLDLKTTLVARALALKAELAAYKSTARELDAITDKVNNLSAKLGLDGSITVIDRIEEIAEADDWAEKALNLARVSEGTSSIKAYRMMHDHIMEMTEIVKMRHRSIEGTLAEARKTLTHLNSRVAT